MFFLEINFKFVYSQLHVSDINQLDGAEAFLS
jgi:hypothetical protein